MRVAHIKINNILGIEELEFAPGGFTEISGGNGAGKTSVIEALRAALRGGHDASLLRQGAERGEIVLVLDDGTQLRKAITADKTDVRVLRDEKVVPRPAEAIKALHDVLSVNPVEFLRAPEKARVDALLQVMPIKVSADRLQEITGNLVRPDGGAMAKLSGIDLVEACKKAVFDERTGVNRAARDKEGAVNQLRATLPDVVPEVPETDASLLVMVDEIDQLRDAELRRIDEKLAGLNAKCQDQIDELRGLIAQLEEKIAEHNGRAEAARQAARADHQIARAGVQAQLDNITAAQEQHARYKVTVENVTRMVDELQALKDEAAGYTAALEALDAYKADLLASLPIHGLEVIDGKLYRHGVPFDRLNTAQQVDIAVEIAKLRAGELGLICVDGLELLDAAAYEAFRERAEASGLQMIVSRVSDGGLQVQAA
jgi:DNA repair exonuclease SbcCD ATPase subunit